MKATAVHFYKDYSGHTGYRRSTCEIEIPGIGTVSMENILSNETMDRVIAEVEEAAKLKLNIVRPENKEN